MRIGTKSVLFGIHNPLWHGPTVWWAYFLLYGSEAFSLPVVAACFLHDLGYWGKPNMDGLEGEQHPYQGAELMHQLFDRGFETYQDYHEWNTTPRWRRSRAWYYFTLLHSRHLAKNLSRPYSKLAVADKLAIAITPRWFYWLVTTLTGEIREYQEQFPVKGLSKWEWLTAIQAKMKKWAQDNKGEAFNYV